MPFTLFKMVENICLLQILPNVFTDGSLEEIDIMGAKLRKISHWDGKMDVILPDPPVNNRIMLTDRSAVQQK